MAHAGPSNTPADPSSSPVLQAANISIHNAFAAECGAYFVWQTLGLVYSFEQSGQPGPLTRLLSCTGATAIFARVCHCSHTRRSDVSTTRLIMSMLGAGLQLARRTAADGLCTDDGATAASVRGHEMAGGQHNLLNGVLDLLQTKTGTSTRSRMPSGRTGRRRGPSIRATPTCTRRTTSRRPSSTGSSTTRRPFGNTTLSGLVSIYLHGTPTCDMP